MQSPPRPNQPPSRPSSRRPKPPSPAAQRRSRCGTFANGLRYRFVYDPRAASVSVVLFVAAGSRHEPLPEDYGVAHFVEHMLFRSTLRSTRQQLLDRIYRGGGTVNGATDLDTTHYWCRVSRTSLAPALDTLAEMMREPRFDPAELERERKVVQNELYSVRSDPQSWLLDEVLPPLAFAADAGLAHPIGGDPDQIARMDADQLHAFFHTWYRPKNMCLAVYGRWTPPPPPPPPRSGSSTSSTGSSSPLSWLSTLARERYGQWKGPSESFRIRSSDAFHRHVQRYQAVAEGIEVKSASPSSPPPASSSIRAGTFLVTRPALDETTVVLLGNGHPFRARVPRLRQRIVVAALVDTMISRLFLELREDRGLVYSVKSGPAFVLNDQGRVGLMFFTPTRRPQDTRQALTVIEEVRQQLLRSGLSAEERSRFRQYVTERLRLSRENTLGMAEWYGEHWLRHEKEPKKDEGQKDTVQADHAPLSFARYIRDTARVSDDELQDSVRGFARAMAPDAPDGRVTLILTGSEPEWRGAFEQWPDVKVQFLATANKDADLTDSKSSSHPGGIHGGGCWDAITSNLPLSSDIAITSNLPLSSDITIIIHRVLQWLIAADIRLVGWDFDLTAYRLHTGGPLHTRSDPTSSATHSMSERLQSIAADLSPAFHALVLAIHHRLPNVKQAILTYSDGRFNTAAETKGAWNVSFHGAPMIRQVLDRAFHPRPSRDVIAIVIGHNPELDDDDDERRRIAKETTMSTLVFERSKNTHFTEAARRLGLCGVRPDQTLLIDDAWHNVAEARRVGRHAWQVQPPAAGFVWTDVPDLVRR